MQREHQARGESVASSTEKRIADFRARIADRKPKKARNTFRSPCGRRELWFCRSLHVMGTRSFMSAVRKWSRPVHRDLSFSFGRTADLCGFGFMLNHKRDFNSDYSVRRTELVFAQEIRASRSGPVRGPRNCSRVGEAIT